MVEALHKFALSRPNLTRGTADLRALRASRAFVLASTPRASGRPRTLLGVAGSLSTTPAGGEEMRCAGLTRWSRGGHYSNSTPPQPANSSLPVATLAPSFITVAPLCHSFEPVATTLSDTAPQHQTLRDLNPSAWRSGPQKNSTAHDQLPFQ